MIHLKPIAHHLSVDLSELVDCDELGFVDSVGSRLITFVETEEFMERALRNPWVKAVLCHSDVSIDIDRNDVTILRCDVPTIAFFELHEALPMRLEKPTEIHPTAKVHHSAIVAASGVQIDANSVVEAHVSIESGTSIGRGCLIRAGARIGGASLDFKTRPDGSPLVTQHRGFLQIDDDVEIGYNSVVDRATFRQQFTRIGAGTRVSSHCNISHGVSLGERNKLAAGVQISGGTTVGDENWFGPGVVVSHLKTIGSHNEISISSTVLKNLENGELVVAPASRIFRDKRPF